MPGSVLLLRVWSKGWNGARLCSFIGHFLCLLPFHPQASPPHPSRPSSQKLPSLTLWSWADFPPVSSHWALHLPSYSVICFPAETRSDSLYPEYLALCVLRILPCASWVSCLVCPEYLASRLALNRHSETVERMSERMNECMGQGFTGWYSCCFKSSPPFYLHPSLFCEFQTGKREGKGEEDSFPIKVSLRIHRGDCHLEKGRLVGSEGNLNISKNCGWVRSVKVIKGSNETVL